VTALKAKAAPLRLDIVHKHDVRTQFGALCYRVHNNRIQVLLVTSRGTGRWIIPKGWPMDGETPAGAAATEAYEEAGVEGKPSNICLGIYSYTKTLPKKETLPCVVAVFPFQVKRIVKKFPEAGQRKRKWFSQKKAAALVSDPELGNLILQFRPKNTRK
jgi:8-oxo-dGTP pyrophosphatase MutT (NUDIX family)